MKLEVTLSNPTIFVKALSFTTEPPTDDPYNLPPGVEVVGAVCHTIDYRGGAPTVGHFPLTEEEQAILLSLVRRVQARLR